MGRAPRARSHKVPDANARSVNNINHESGRGHHTGGEAIGERDLVATQIWLKASPASAEQFELCQSPRGLKAAGREWPPVGTILSFAR